MTTTSQQPEANVQRHPARQAQLDACRGKDVLMLGPLGNYAGYRQGEVGFWDFHVLAQTARSLVGLDINEDLVAVARQDGYDIRVGDAEDFDAGRGYDVIYAPDLIEHLGNPLRCLTCCVAALRLGGVILMETPNPIAINVLLRGLITGRVDALEEHTCWIDKRNAQELARRAGLRIEVSCYTPLNPFNAGMRLRTRVYSALTALRSQWGAKLVFRMWRGD